MWETLKIEEATKHSLIQERGQAEGEEKYALYLAARKSLVEEILEEIKAVEPTLTDHGPKHVANVLKNINLIIGNDISKLSGTELYCLTLATLFHDTGNLGGRHDHQHKISSIYDFVRKDGERFKQEKMIVLQVVAAHCGTAPDNSKDTLRFVDSTQLDGKPVNLRYIAAILRLADELAEGPQRTSLFMQQFGYPADSRIYHDYANMTDVCVDAGNNRIALTYNVEVRIKEGELLPDEDHLKQTIDFIYRRILKLDQERKYAKHYCALLNSLKEVSVFLCFWHLGEPIDLGLRPLILTDLTVPGDAHKQIQEYDKSYSIENLIVTIRDSLSTAKPKDRSFAQTLTNAIRGRK
jgi:hypothetical protein